jgi:cytoskeletal protein RodZ
MAVFGDTLRQARAHKGVTLKEAELATRINRHHLLALEEEHFNELPPLIYQRGIVRNYANFLNLDSNKVLSMFDAARGDDPDDAPIIQQAHPDVPSHWAPNFAIIAFLVVMSAVVFAWGYSAYFSSGGTPTVPEEVIPTVTVTGDKVFMPTPTNTPTATPTPSPTATPEPTQPPVQIEEEADEPDSQRDDDEDVRPVEEEDEPAATSGALTFSFLADVDIDSLTIIADGVEIFSGYLPAGVSTGYVSADMFQVYVSDPGALQIVRENGDSFYMGDNFFELP